MIMFKNYYLILGVEAKATQEEIEAAYLRQAGEFHPESYGGGSAPYLAIQEAYAVLSDSGRRQAYDRSIRERRFQTPSEEVRPEPLQTRKTSAEPLIPTRESMDLGEISLTQSFQTFRPSFEDIFDRLWSNFTSLTKPKAEKIESLSVEIPLSPGEAFRGGQARILVPAQVQCPICRGKRAVGPFGCWRCRGEGGIPGEYPILVRYPAAISQDYTVKVPLDHLGIHNFYLTIHFRISGMTG